MNKTIALLAALLLLAKVGSSQRALYNSYVKTADSLYKTKNYQKAAIEYSKAFKLFGGLGTTIDKYNSACCWSLINNLDSAFTQLYQAVIRGGFADFDQISKDSDLNNLHKDLRWKPLLDSTLENQNEVNSKINQPLKKELEFIIDEDQESRKQYSEAIKKFGITSEQANESLKKMRHTDSINLSKVTSILNKYGWVGSEVVGQKGNQALWVVLQHANLSTQKKYLPMMQTALENGNLRPSNYAFTFDRVLIREGKKQIYGTQIGSNPNNPRQYFVLPLIAPDQVNERRAKMSLGPIEEYLKNWDLKWDLQKYKKLLPIYIEWSKRTSTTESKN